MIQVFLTTISHLARFQVSILTLTFCSVSVMPFELPKLFLRLRRPVGWSAARLYFTPVRALVRAFVPA